MVSCNDQFVSGGVNLLLWWLLWDFAQLLNCSLNACTRPICLWMCHSMLVSPMFHLCDNDDSNYEFPLIVLIADGMEPIDFVHEPDDSQKKIDNFSLHIDQITALLIDDGMRAYLISDCCCIVAWFTHADGQMQMFLRHRCPKLRAVSTENVPTWSKLW